MFENLNGKRLLYLGGISRARWVVMRARELGIYVIVADYNEDSPAKTVANEGILANAMDVDAMVALGNEKHIDGVMTGYCDILLPVCKEVAARLGLPCYMTEDMIKVATDKGFFKQACGRHNVPVPRSYDVSSIDDAVISELTYPVFIKPMDASGSRGASASYGPDDFRQKYEGALSYSKSKRVSVEECLTGTAFILDYALINGTPHLLSMADCYSCPGRPAAINSPNLMIMPSKNIRRYIDEVDPCVSKFFAANSFRDGIFFFQGYANEKKITFYEAGCRLGGTWPYIDQHFYGINPLDMLFSHAITGKMVDNENVSQMNGLFNGMAASVYFLAAAPSGRIDKVKGVSELQQLSYAVNVMQYYYEGDSFDCVKERSADIRFMSIHLVANNYNELLVRIKHVYDIVDFLGEDGSSLLAPVYNLNALSGYKGE